jgi:hypothetical protein
MEVDMKVLGMMAVMSLVAVPTMAAESSSFLALTKVKQTTPVEKQTVVQLTDTELSKVQGADNICVVCANANVQAQILTNKSVQQTGNQTNQR